MLEHHTAHLLTPREFVRRQTRYTLVSVFVIAVSLGIGAAGYHFLEHADWLDAVYDAAMILTGMGPALTPHSAGSKLFVTTYALFSAMIFLTVAGIFMTPIVHRIMHRLHLKQLQHDARL